MVLAGLLVGAAGRVVTASVIGANIGGGLVLLVGVPVVAALVIGAAVWSVDLLRRPVLAPDGVPFDRTDEAEAVPRSLRDHNR